MVVDGEAGVGVVGEVTESSCQVPGGGGPSGHTGRVSGTSITIDERVELCGGLPTVSWRTWVVARALVLVVAGVLGVAVLYLVAVRTGIGQRLDDAVVSGRAEQRSWFRWSVVARLTRRSGLVLLAGAALAFGWALSRRRFAQAAAAAMVIGGSFATSEMLKKAVLDRPSLDTTYPFNSYPSGHATVAVAVAVGLILVAPQLWRGTVALVVGAPATMVANGTLAIGWHRPSDAIGASLVVLAWSAATFAVLTLLGGASRARPGRARRVSFGFWVLGAVTLIAALPGLWELGGLLRRLSNPERLATGELKHLYNTADLLVLASVTGVIALVLVMLHGVSLHRAGGPRRSAPARSTAHVRWAGSRAKRERVIVRPRTVAIISPSGENHAAGLHRRARGASLRTAGLLRPHPHRRGS